MPRDRIPGFRGRGIFWWFGREGEAATRQHSGISKACDFLVACRERGSGHETEFRNFEGVGFLGGLQGTRGKRPRYRIPEFEGVGFFVACRERGGCGHATEFLNFGGVGFIGGLQGTERGGHETEFRNFEGKAAAMQNSGILKACDFSVVCRKRGRRPRNRISKF